MMILPKPDACEECGEKDFSANWLPEGQCVCDECACAYWEEDNQYEEEEE